MYLKNLPLDKCGLILGYTTRKHLLLDLDNCSIDKAHKLADLLIKSWPIIGNCLIVESSVKPLNLNLIYIPLKTPLMVTQRPNTHLIFSGKIGLNLCTKICSILAGLNVLNHGYEDIRRFRGDMTLRVSHAVTTEGLKLPPKVKTYIKNKDYKGDNEMIHNYLRALSSGQSLLLADFHPEHKPDNCSDSAYDNRKILAINATDEGRSFDG